MTVHLLPGRGYDCNIFLVSGSKPVVVDAGTGHNAVRTLEIIARLTGGNKVHAIILTHRHYDHIGGAAQLSKALGAPVFAHRLDACVVREGSYRGTEAILFQERVEPVEVNDLEGGETFSTGDHDLKVIHTPGHSAGGICLFDSGKKILVSGDTVFAGGVGRWDLTTGDREKLGASVRALLELAPVDLYPGHGPCALGDATEQMKDALTYLGEF